MKIATTTEDFLSYCSDEKEKIRTIHECGFKYIDFSFYTEAKKDSLFLEDNWKEYTQELKEYAESIGCQFVQAHSPGGNPLSFDDQYVLLLKSTIRSIEACAILGIPNTVVHSGFMLGISKDEFFEKNLEFYKKLFPVMEETGVNVLIENSAKANMGGSYYFFTGKEMKEFLQYAAHPLLHACWDTGHANIEGHQYEDIIALSDDLYALHINDNRGKMDEHIMIFTGTLNMDEVMHGLKDINYKGAFTFESSNTLLRTHKWPIERKTYDKYQRLENPTLEMQMDMEKLKYKIGEHVLKAYDYNID